MGTTLFPIDAVAVFVKHSQIGYAQLCATESHSKTVQSFLFVRDGDVPDRNHIEFFFKLLHALCRSRAYPVHVPSWTSIHIANYSTTAFVFYSFLVIPLNSSTRIFSPSYESFDASSDANMPLFAMAFCVRP